MTVGPNAEEIRDRADEILSRPEYREAAPSLIDRAFSWLQEQLSQILGPIVTAGGTYWYD